MNFFSAIFLGEALSVPEFLLFMVGVCVVGTIIVTLVSVGADKSKEVAKKIKVNLEQRKQDSELNKSIQSNMQEYQEAKNNFQYFSDAKLLDIYKKFQNGSNTSNMEQLALEEELVKRKVITHSPMHEKLYAINKELFK